MWWPKASPFRTETLPSGPQRQFGPSHRSLGNCLTVRAAPGTSPTADRTTAATAAGSGAGPCLRLGKTGETEATSDSLYASTIERTGALLLQDSLPGYFHERGDRHENWSHRVQGSGELPKAFQYFVFFWFVCFVMPRMILIDFSKSGFRNSAVLYFENVSNFGEYCWPPSSEVIMRNWCWYWLVQSVISSCLRVPRPVLAINHIVTCREEWFCTYTLNRSSARRQEKFYASDNVLICLVGKWKRSWLRSSLPAICTSDVNFANSKVCFFTCTGMTKVVSHFEHIFRPMLFGRHFQNRVHWLTQVTFSGK